MSQRCDMCFELRRVGVGDGPPCPSCVTEREVTRLWLDGKVSLRTVLWHWRARMGWA